VIFICGSYCCIQRIEINGESTSMVWPTLGSRTAKEQNCCIQPFKHFSNTNLLAACYCLSDRQSGQAGTRKVKRIQMVAKQEMMGSQWHQLDHMQIICTSLQTDNHASTSSLKFSQGRMLFLTPSQQCPSTEVNVKALEAYLQNFMGFKSSFST